MSKFSIIIPTYNRASVVTRAVKSVLKQYFNNWELIIIDDGSDDGTKESLEEYLKDERVTYKYQNRSGVSAARNKGLELASGEYIIFLDSDDELYPALTKDLVEYKVDDYDLVFWYVRRIKKSKVEVTRPHKLEKLYNGITAIFLSGSVCYKKDLLMKIQGFDETLEFGENYEMGMRLVRKHPKLNTGIIPKVYLNYFMKFNTRSSSEPETKLNSLKFLLKKHVKYYEKDPYSYSRLLYQIGFYLEKTGDKLEAVKYYDKALSIDCLYLKPILKKILYKIRYYKI